MSKIAITSLWKGISSGILRSPQERLHWQFHVSTKSLTIKLVSVGSKGRKNVTCLKVWDNEPALGHRKCLRIVIIRDIHNLRVYWLRERDYRTLFGFKVIMKWPDQSSFYKTSLLKKRQIFVFIFILSLIEIYFIHHRIHLFNLNSSVVFMNSRKNTSHQNLILECFSVTTSTTTTKNKKPTNQPTKQT